MLYRDITICPVSIYSNQLDLNLTSNIIVPEFASDNSLAATITKTSSKQTYYTIRFLADRDRMTNNYRAYAYFRWVDDCLDEEAWEKAQRLAFVQRQQALIDGGYQGEWPGDLTVEERMLQDLIRSDQAQNSGLQSYLRNMMAVMAFDAMRRGRVISRQELTAYTQHLAIGVTDALHYFIGHDDPAPQHEDRYLAVTAAHITHMLRDTYEDIAAGYFNIPGEFLESHGIDPWAVETHAYREWVKGRVGLARTYFEAGRAYIARTRNLRRRMAGYAYTARFEVVLDILARDGFRLRPAYPERKTLKSGLRMAWSVLTNMLIR